MCGDLGVPLPERVCGDLGAPSGLYTEILPRKGAG